MSSPPRRRTVDDVAAPYANFLIPAPVDADDVCPVCRGVREGFATCFTCNQARKALAGGIADVTAVVSIAPRGEQRAHELAAYKHPNVPLVVRQRMVTGLAAVLWKWLSAHEGCMANRVGRSAFDVVTSVPSMSGRGDHPLPHLVSGVVSGTGARYKELLAVNRIDLEQRVQAADRFRAVRSLGGTSVLVVDDTWTTGAHAQSASATLKAAGAARVGLVAVGRWFNLDFGDGARWLSARRREPWDWARCCLDRPRVV